MSTSRLMQMAAAGAGNHPAPLPIGIEDYFSTYLYTGNGSTQTITNGIDLAGEGGLVWIKPRVLSDRHLFVDTERGSDRVLASNNTNAEIIATNPSFQPIESFNSNGFTVGAFNDANDSGDPHASWTFRKAPRFFDVVTWDGTANQTIQHSLGVDPGCIIVKRTGASEDWWVYHRSVATDLNLNSSSAALGYSVISSVTSASFGVNLNTTTSPDGYVAYLFAHDPLGPSGDGSDGLIACGSYTGTGVTDGPEINLGWEPQWVMIKATSRTGDWYIFDNMRGITAGGEDPWLAANLSNAEWAGQDHIDVTPTGFKLRTEGYGGTDNSGSTYIYIAIRRGPMRQPTSGTEVFAVDTRGSTGDGLAPALRSGWPVDMSIFVQNKNTVGNKNQIGSRLTGTGMMYTNLTDAETTNTGFLWDFNNGWVNATNTDANDLGWMFRRAPGFFDVVAYTGGTNAVPHNLGVSPELVIVKQRNASGNNWAVGASFTASNFVFGYLNSTYAGVESSYTNRDFSQQPDENNVYLNTASSRVNTSGNTYIAYLFATLPGVSKVGSYTGNGTSQTINCGFTSGARFVLIKRTDSTGDWYVWDTERGIVAANDPHLSLNTTAAEVTTDDSVDPDATGFIVNQVAATNINVNAASYIYIAIA